jgi:hypothetical protein
MPDILVYTTSSDGQILVTSVGSTQGIPAITPSGQITAPATPTYVQSLTLSFVQPGTNDQLIFGPGYSGFTIQGGQKLVQRFLLQLLTVQGSILYRPQIGTNFVPELQTPLGSNESDVFAAFAAAMLTLGPNMWAEELVTDPPDERFSSATMTQLTVGSGSLSATIVIVSLAGGTQTMSLPLNFAI